MNRKSQSTVEYLVILSAITVTVITFCAIVFKPAIGDMLDTIIRKVFQPQILG